MKKDILVPDIGDFDNVEIIEVLVKEGQKIQKTILLLHLKVINQVWRFQAPKKVMF